MKIRETQISRAAGMSTRSILPLLLVTMLCIGCIEIEETVTLQKDGSGKVHMDVTFPQLAVPVEGNVTGPAPRFSLTATGTHAP